MKRKRSNTKKREAPKDGTMIIGRNSVREVLMAHPERVHSISLASKEKGIIADIVNLSRQAQVRIDEKEFDELTRISGTESHQGVILFRKRDESFSLTDLLNTLEEKESALVILLDGIEDPQNFGAILRAAECYGVDGVIWSKNRCCGVTPVVTKVAMGATELVHLAAVSNLAQAVKELKDSGFWIYTADVGQGAQPVSEVSFDKKTALLLGSESSGPKKLSKENADVLVYIPLKGRIDSLNVSQATSVLLHEIRRGI